MTLADALPIAVDEEWESAWNNFATIYPHECYAAWPERFWAWFHQQHPQVPRTEMERMLRETVEPEERA